MVERGVWERADNRCKQMVTQGLGYNAFCKADNDRNSRLTRVPMIGHNAFCKADNDRNSRLTRVPMIGHNGKYCRGLQHKFRVPKQENMHTERA